MKRNRCCRRAFTLALVIAVMGIVGATLTLLSFHAATYYRNHQADRLRLTCRAVTDSVAALARSRAPEWRAHRPAQPLSIDIASLLPAGAQGTALITFPSPTTSSAPAGPEHNALTTSQPAPLTCHLAIRIIRGRYQIADELDQDLP